MDEESREIKTMRHMAWERAKGELFSIATTFWGNEDKYTEFKNKVESFISHIDSNGIVD